MYRGKGRAPAPSRGSWEGKRIEPLLLVSDRFGRACAETRIDAHGPGACGPGAGAITAGRGPASTAGSSAAPAWSENPTPALSHRAGNRPGASAITANRGPASTRGQLSGSLRTAKDQRVISPVERLDRGRPGGAGLVVARAAGCLLAGKRAGKEQAPEYSGCTNRGVLCQVAGKRAGKEQAPGPFPGRSEQRNISGRRLGRPCLTGKEQARTGSGAVPRGPV